MNDKNLTQNFTGELLQIDECDDQIAHLLTLFECRALTHNRYEHDALTAMIRDNLTELGYPPTAADDKQIDTNL